MKDKNTYSQLTSDQRAGRTPVLDMKWLAMHPEPTVKVNWYETFSGALIIILIIILVISFSFAATDHGVPSPGTAKVSEELTF